MRKRWALAAAVLVLALAGVGWALYRLREPKAAPAPKSTPPAVVVGNDAVLKGTVQPARTVRVAAPIAGVIDAMFAEVGQAVEEGQLLARIKNWEFETATEAAAAELEQAQARVARAEELIVGARLESSRAAADLSRARSDLDRLEKEFKRQSLLFKEGATPRLLYEKTQHEYESARQD